MNKQKSFTLIELLVVIVIIGILAGVIMISTSSSIDKASIAKSKVFEESIQNNLAANMVSRWTLDEVIGTAAPYTTPDQWGSNTGTLYGTNGLPQLRPSSECVTGGCFLFDGVDDYVEILSQPNLHPTREYSITLWMKAGTLKEWSGLVGTYPFTNGYLIYQASSEGYPVGVAYVEGVRKDVNSNFKPISGRWHFIAFTVKQGESTKIYVDGELKKTTIIPSTGSVTTNGNPLRIAGQGSGTPLWFDGLIDDVKIYNSALLSLQIKKDYIAGLESLLSKGTLSEAEFKENIKKMSSNK
ncbi:MAG TPA: prepilin-type N-terminal cleavage/methylation domain-containing protein [Candidatus Pacearchaeota archaeon]|nr:prepilin-type N-terminal cleavage/methylation domain-containing protein [Candidatus Pacearchaeota archaeon]